MSADLSAKETAKQMQKRLFEIVTPRAMLPAAHIQADLPAAFGD